MMFEYVMVLDSLERLRDLCHNNSKVKGFWDAKEWNFGEKIALIHTELSEMFEAWRCNKKECEKDITIIDSTMRSETGEVEIRRITAIEEEIADVFIRMFDLCGKLNIDVGRVVMAKMEYNKNRPHMHGGRKC